MSVHLPLLTGSGEPSGLRLARVARLETSAFGRTAVQSMCPAGPGAHREPGSTPWRTGLREIVLMVTWGRLELFCPVTRHVFAPR